MDEVKEIWPELDTDQFGAFAFEPQGGYGDTVLTNQAFADAARAWGGSKNYRSKKKLPV